MAYKYVPMRELPLPERGGGKHLLRRFIISRSRRRVSFDCRAAIFVLDLQSNNLLLAAKVADGGASIPVPRSSMSTKQDFTRISDYKDRQSPRISMKLFTMLCVLFVLYQSI